MDILLRLKTLVAVLSLLTSLGLQMESTTINEYNEMIYMVKASVSDALILEQRLSYGQVFGFETIVSLGEKEREGTHYDIGVNGAFYNDLGIPSGMVINDGEWICGISQGVPMFLLDNNHRASIEMVTAFASVQHDELNIQLENINGSLREGGYYLFTKWFGSTNRIHQWHTSIVVKEGLVTEVIYQNSPVNVDENTYFAQEKGSYVLSVLGDQRELWTTGKECKLTVDSSLNLEEYQMGFQTGGYLVKSGENVSEQAVATVDWKGSLQPRTAMGLTFDGQVLFIVVDGRNPGISEGVTGDMLAEMFIEAGCIVAANLDGGASTTLVQNGQVINRPSKDGEAKGVSHGLFIDRLWENMLR